MNKKVLIGVVATIAVGGLSFVGYKAYTYNCYKVDKEDKVERLKFSKTLSVKQSEKVSDYAEFGNLKFQNIFEGYEKKESENKVTYSKKNDKGKEQVITISKSEGIVKDILDNKKTDDKSYNKIDKKEFIEKYKIKNDIDLIKYLQGKRRVDVNMFTSKSILQEQYFLDMTEVLHFNTDSSRVWIKAPYEGYIRLDKNVENIIIFDEKYKYEISFVGDYSYMTVTDFLKTISVK